MSAYLLKEKWFIQQAHSPKHLSIGVTLILQLGRSRAKKVTQQTLTLLYLLPDATSDIADSKQFNYKHTTFEN